MAHYAGIFFGCFVGTLIGLYLIEKFGKKR